MLKALHSNMFKTILVIALLAFVLAHDAQADKQYYIYPDQETFIGAWIGCKSAGMKLANVESLNDQTALEKAISHSADKSNTGYWIGAATAVFNDNGWYWLDAEVKMTYSNWGTGQPRYSEDDAETGYCVRVGNFYKISESSKWENIDCNSKLYYICELKA
ncbi:perlucin-like protein [Euwallacea similis]|uniref:perlucin-like protein n=1 Tax=Euwallacea similis TaxID=1736056 RepID=UPI00344DBA0A